MATARLFANMLNEGVVTPKQKPKRKEFSPWVNINKGKKYEKK